VDQEMGYGESSGADQSTATTGSPSTLGQSPAKGNGLGGAYGGLEETMWCGSTNFFTWRRWITPLKKAQPSFTACPRFKTLAATINFPGGMLLGEVNSMLRFWG